MNHNLITMVVMAVGLASSGANAATIHYVLTDGKIEAGPGEYAKITLADIAAESEAVHVKIETTGDMSADGNAGIMAFGFNVGTDATAGSGDHGVTGDGDKDAMVEFNIAGLPDGWSLRHDKELGDYGRFDHVIKSTGNSRQDSLEFSLSGVSSGDIGDDFALFVSGGPVGKDGINGLFGDAKPVVDDPPKVPLPAAAWLLGSGLLGMGVIARRRNRDTSLLQA